MTSPPSTPTGILHLVDRTKDVIKSGGEWVSSIDLENIAEAAVIGVPHPKWQERPLLVAVLRKGHSATREEILELSGRRGRQVVAVRRGDLRRRAAAHRNRQGTQGQVA